MATLVPSLHHYHTHILSSWLCMLPAPTASSLAQPPVQAHLCLHRLCFKRLVVSEDAPLRFLYERKNEMKDPGYAAYRSQWMAKYQDHIFAAEKLEAMVSLVCSTHRRAASLMSCRVQLWDQVP